MISPSTTELWLTDMTAVTWQFAVLAITTWGLLTVFEDHLSARARHLIWLMVLLRLVLPVGIASPWGLASQGPKVSIPSVDSQQVPARQFSPTSEPTAPPVSQPPVGRNGGSILLAIWASLSAMLLATWLYRSVQFEIRIRGSWEVTPEWLQEEVNFLRNRLGIARPIRAGFVDESLISGPGITGFMRPRLVLPLSMLANMTNEQRTPVIVHELIHIARRDHIVQPLIAILHCLYFFHPVVWLVVRKIRSEREKAVDDRVVSSLGERPTDYAEVLLRFAQTGRFHRQAPALGMASPQSQVARRLARMLDDGYRANQRSRRSALAVVSLSIFVTLTVAASSLRTSAHEGDRKGVSVTITYPEAQILRDGEPAWVELTGDFEIGHANIEEGDLMARLSAISDETFILLADHSAVLEAIVDRTGQPVSVNVLDEVERSLDDILIEFTEALEFAPTLHYRDGPVPFKVQLHFGIPREEPKFVAHNRTPSLGSDELEARLKEVYSLQPGRALKLLPPPHPEERLEFYRLRGTGRAKSVPNGPDMMLVEVRDGVPWVRGNGFGAVTVKRVMTMAGFSGARIFGDANALEREFYADIVVSENSDTEQRLRDLAQEMEERFAVRLEPIQRDTQVIVIRGSFGEIIGPGVNSGPPSIWITLDAQEEDGTGGGMAQSAPEFARLLETILDFPVEVEGVPDPEHPVLVRFGASAYRTERLQELFERIEGQCDLEFSLENREVELFNVEDIKD